MAKVPKPELPSVPQTPQQLPLSLLERSARLASTELCRMGAQSPTSRSSSRCPRCHVLEMQNEALIEKIVSLTKPPL